MLVCFITVGLLLFCLITALVWFIQKDDGWTIAFLPGMALVLVAVAMFGSVATINSDEEAWKIKNEVVLLNREYDRLCHIDVDRDRVQRYNERARDFNERLERNQSILGNPWVSWFTCYAWNDYNSEDVKEIILIISTHPR